MKPQTVWILVAVLLASGAAQATRVAGVALPQATHTGHPASATSVLSGVVTEVDLSNAQVQIDGHWFTLKKGRTQLLRQGLPVDASVLREGLQVRYNLASQAAGELALGVVYVP